MNHERALVQRIKDGEESAFRELVEQYKQRIYYLALDMSGNHFDAEDISQEVFIKAYRGIGRFKSNAKLSTWLHRITVNAFLDSKRRKTNVVNISDMTNDDDGMNPLEVAVEGSDNNPETVASSAVIDRHIQAALERLSDQERTVFVMRHYHDLPLREISESLGVAEGTVKSLLFRSIRKLRGALAVYRDELGLEDNAQ